MQIGIFVALILRNLCTNYVLAGDGKFLKFPLRRLICSYSMQLYLEYRVHCGIVYVTFNK